MRIKFLVVAVLVAALLAVLAVRASSPSRPPVVAAASRPVVTPAPLPEAAAPAPLYSPPVAAAPAPPQGGINPPNPAVGEIAHKPLFLAQPPPAPPAGSPPLPVPVESAAPPPLANFGQLADGNALWQGPASMVVGDTSPVGITIGPASVLAKDLQAALTNAVGAAGTAQTGTSAVQISPRMTASAAGVGFDITPAGSQEQEVSLTQPTTWSWQATATQAGTRYILVTLTAELPGGARLTTLNRPIGGIVVSKAPLTFQQRLDSLIPLLTSIKAILVLVVAIITTIFTRPVIDFLRRTRAAPADRKRDASPPPAG